jgi:O-antigen/teichoic acid export membrane protein
MVVVVLARGAAAYAALSGAALALWGLAPQIADDLSYLPHADVGPAVVLIRYTVVAFAATNATVLLSAALQGLGRVDRAFRAQTCGAALYLPLLVGLMQALSPAEATGASLLGMYAVELVLAGAALMRELPRVQATSTEVASLAAMFRVGARWQVSSWADFATFQLPRLLAAAGPSSRTALVVDLSLRYGQAIVAPLFIFYPVVLPAATAAWSRDGLEGVRRITQRYVDRGATLLLFAAALAIPLAVPGLELWTGVSLSASEAVAAMSIAAGLVAYASTGVFSTVLLAIDELRLVLRYKGAQLALAGVLLAVAAALGGAALVGVALAAALVGPAVWFGWRAAGRLGVSLRAAAPGAGWSMVIFVVASAGAFLTNGRVPVWYVAAAGLTLLGVTALGGRGRIREIGRPTAAMRKRG